MKILKFLFIFMLVGLVPVFASQKRTEIKQLTVSGVPVIGTSIANSATLTSDGIYQSGNEGFLALATQVSGNVGISYQVSYDNLNWWTPYDSNATSGTLTAAGSIATSITANRWIVSTAVLAPYMRFIYTSTGASVITADTLWQDES